MIFERGHFDKKIVTENFINESLKETRLFSSGIKSTLKPTVFLSHKHDDLNELKGVIGLFNDYGVKVYIDTMDNKMPKETSADTAKRIKEVIKNCNKFILLATDKSIDSIWCNWELGIGDVNKYIDNIAILPIKNKGTYDSEFIGNEYLLIYPKIQFVQNNSIRRKIGGYFDEGYYVVSPVNKDGVSNYTKLTEWLKS